MDGKSESSGIKDALTFELVEKWERELSGMLSSIVSTTLRPLRGKYGKSELLQSALTALWMGYEYETDVERLKKILKGIIRKKALEKCRHYFDADKRDVRLEVRGSNSVFDKLESTIEANLPDMSPSVEDALELVDLFEEMRKGLSEDEYIVLIRSLERIPQARIAEEIGKSVKSVERLKKSALKKCEEFMSQFESY